MDENETLKVFQFLIFHFYQGIGLQSSDVRTWYQHSQRPWGSCHRRHLSGSRAGKTWPKKFIFWGGFCNWSRYPKKWYWKYRVGSEWLVWQLWHNAQVKKKSGKIFLLEKTVLKPVIGHLALLLLWMLCYTWHGGSLGLSQNKFKVQFWSFFDK